MSNDKDNPIDPDISDIYQSTRVEGPGPALDAAILAEAEAAVRPERRRPRWLAPVGLAATVLLGVNLAINLRDYSNAPEIYSETAYPLPRADDDEADKEFVASDEAPKVAGASDTAVTQSHESGSAVPLEINSTAADQAPVPMPLKVPLAQSDVSEPYLQGSATQSAATGAESPAKPSPVPYPEAQYPTTPDQPLTEREAQRSAETNAREMERQRADRNRVLSEKREAELVRSRKEQVASASPAVASSTPGEAPLPESAVEPTPMIVTTADQAASMQALEDRLINDPRLMAQSPAQSSEPDADAPDTEKTGLEEVLVTGSVIERLDDSPHRRMTAKDQALRNARKSAQKRDGAAPEESMAQETAAPVYVCELSALKIDDNLVESAKVDARTAEPPLTATSWPVSIKELADNGNYRAACVQLAAYRQLFPDVVLIEPLPVTLSTDE